MAAPAVGIARQRRPISGSELSAALGVGAADDWPVAIPGAELPALLRLPGAPSIMPVGEAEPSMAPAERRGIRTAAMFAFAPGAAADPTSGPTALPVSPTGDDDGSGPGRRFSHRCGRRNYRTYAVRFPRAALRSCIGSVVVAGSARNPRGLSATWRWSFRRGNTTRPGNAPRDDSRHAAFAREFVPRGRPSRVAPGGVRGYLQH